MNTVYSLVYCLGGGVRQPRTLDTGTGLEKLMLPAKKPNEKKMKFFDEKNEIFIFWWFGCFVLPVFFFSRQPNVFSLCSRATATTNTHTDQTPHPWATTDYDGWLANANHPLCL